MTKFSTFSLLALAIFSLNTLADSLPFIKEEAKELVGILEHRKCHSIGASGPQARQRKSSCSIKVKDVACDESNNNGKATYINCHFIDKQSKSEIVINLPKDTKTNGKNQKLGTILVKYAKKPSVQSINCRLERVINEVKSIECSFIK